MKFLGMKFLEKMKDGGDESSVTGYWLFEIKWLCSIVLLKFDGKSRNAYHNHAFHCINWLLKGNLFEDIIEFKPHPVFSFNHYKPSWKPFIISRSRMHQVSPDPLPTKNKEISWVLSFRGRWTDTWKEYDPTTKYHRVLSKGRVVSKSSVNLKDVL